MIKFKILFLLAIIATSVFAENRFITLMEDIGNGLAKYFLKGTPLEGSLKDDEKDKSIIHKFEKSNSTIEISEYGFLNINSKYDAEIVLMNKATNETYKEKIKKGESLEIKIKKGIYKAELNYDGKSKIYKSVSFLANKGYFEIN